MEGSTLLLRDLYQERLMAFGKWFGNKMYL